MKRNLFIAIVAIFLVWPASNINWSKNHWEDILESDARGYYAYLPAALIYQDLNFGWYEEIENGKYANPNLTYEYRYTFEGKVVNKYFVGTAIMELPFFVVAHLWAGYSDHWDADGYSKPYNVMMNVAAIFYILLSLWLLSSVFGDWFGIKSWWWLVCAVFGTNLFYYTISEPGMSHAFTFSLVSVLIYFIYKYSRSKHLNYSSLFILLSGISIGLIVLIRPVNILVLLALPFLFNFFEIEIKEIFKTSRGTVLISMCLCLVVMAIQPMVYYIQTGSFLVYSYGEEGFNWTNPQILNAFFSFRKGAFIYTPILLLGIPALGYLFLKVRKQFYLFMLFLIPLLYVDYSWWNWWYGGSFSQRVLIDFYPLFFLVIAMWFHSITIRNLKVAVLAFSALCIVWGQFQTYQYRYNIIKWDNMTRGEYTEDMLRIN